MVSVLRLAALLAAAALLAVAPSAAQSSSGIEAGDVLLGPIPPQELPQGSCGLFLWARGDEPMLILAAFHDTSQARVRVDGSIRSLRRTRFAGERQFGHFEHQIFNEGRLTLDVDLVFDQTRQMRDGAMVESGVIRVTSRDGTLTVVPVGGMVACKT